MLRIVPHTVPRVGRSYEHFPDGFELHLLLRARKTDEGVRLEQEGDEGGGTGRWGRGEFQGVGSANP